MTDTGCVVATDGGLITDLCGAHDGNLRAIESLLAVRVLPQGNRLAVDSDDPDVRRLFEQVVRELENHLRSGNVVTPSVVQSVFDAVVEDQSVSALLRSNMILIPNGLAKVFPRTIHQARFVAGMSNSTMAFGIGPAGTGKTYLAVAHALAEVLSRKKRKLVLTRPVVEAGESLGYLPGDLSQKLNPYLRPLYDAMEALIPFESIRRLEEQHLIEIAPLAYMRGRSLRDAYIILDEAQNTTREQMKMFLTRLGENSRAVITGDVTQVDLPRRAESGLIHAQRILADLDEIHFTYFSRSDVVRNPLVRKIVAAYEMDEA